MDKENISRYLEHLSLNSYVYVAALNYSRHLEGIKFTDRENLNAIFLLD